MKLNDTAFLHMTIREAVTKAMHDDWNSRRLTRDLADGQTFHVYLSMTFEVPGKLAKIVLAEVLEAEAAKAILPSVSTRRS